MRVAAIEEEWGKTFTEVLQDLAERGKTAADIARMLGCCPSTIRYHAKKRGVVLPAGRQWRSKSIHAYK